MEQEPNLTDNSACLPLPTYTCHKEVQAVKITKIVYHADTVDENTETDGSAIIHAERCTPFSVDADYIRKHNPQVGGYFVVYKDGYKSFSPAEAFEEGYALKEVVRKSEAEKAEEKTLYNPACAVTGIRSDLQMFPIRDDNGSMIGWIFLADNIERNDFVFSLNTELKVTKTTS